MARPFVEFIQSQCLNWSAFPARAQHSGVDYKLLSEDAETGDCTALLRYPPNWHAPTSEICSADEEVFVLSGALSLAGRAMTRHHYAYWPSGYSKRSFCAGPEGAVVITVFSKTPEYTEISAEDAPYEPVPGFVEHLDCFALPWDNSSMDPNISHLNAYRKNLRLAPDGMCRTYLLAGLPQGFPHSGEEPLERHPHAEEMFMISGDMPCSLGIMRAGAYFYRPPNIWHGADCTVSGFLLFCRTPGANKTVSEWAKDTHPVLFEPDYKPVLPDGLKGDFKAIDDPIVY